jgi:peptide/nickel transport system permease protein
MTQAVTPLAGNTAGLWASSSQVFLTGPAGRVGLICVATIVSIALIGPNIAPYSPTAIGIAPPSSGPSSLHWLGGDTLGRDVFSRLLHGGRLILVLPTLATLLGFAIGGTLGLLSGYKRGWTDLIITRLVDIVLSVPPLLIVMVMVIVLGSSHAVLVSVVGIFFAPRIARIIRGATQAVCAEDYVVAARARGETTFAILLREIAPNMTGPLLAEFALRLNYAIITITTLNFLGLGVQPPTPDWGLMVSEGRIILTLAPLASLAPAALVGTLAIGINLIADQIASHLARNVRRDIRL